MIPIGDDNSDLRIRPFVTWLLLAANVFVFVVLQGLGTNERFTHGLRDGARGDPDGHETSRRRSRCATSTAGRSARSRSRRRPSPST